MQHDVGSRRADAMPPTMMMPPRLFHTDLAILGDIGIVNVPLLTALVLAAVVTWISCLCATPAEACLVNAGHGAYGCRYVGIICRCRVVRARMANFMGFSNRNSGATVTGDFLADHWPQLRARANQGASATFESQDRSSAEPGSSQDSNKRFHGQEPFILEGY
jgi:hypothetical protein